MPEQDQAPDRSPTSPTKSKFKRRVYLSLGTAIAASAAAVTLIKVPIACSCGNPATSLAGAYVRSQQAYFEEHRVFSKSLQELDLSLPNQSTRYEYSVEVAGDRAFIYATPRVVPNDLLRLGLSKAEIAGVVGAVIYDPRPKATTSIVCFAAEGSSGKPPQPSFQNSAFTCPAGFKSRV